MGINKYPVFRRSTCGDISDHHFGRIIKAMYIARRLRRLGVKNCTYALGILLQQTVVIIGIGRKAVLINVYSVAV